MLYSISTCLIYQLTKSIIKITNSKQKDSRQLLHLHTKVDGSEFMTMEGIRNHWEKEIV